MKRLSLPVEYSTIGFRKHLQIILRKKISGLLVNNFEAPKIGLYVFSGLQFEEFIAATQVFKGC